MKKQISGVILDIQREVKDEMGKPQKKGPVSKLYTAKVRRFVHCLALFNDNMICGQKCLFNQLLSIRKRQ